jgi:hypothetical protein
MIPEEEHSDVSRFKFWCSPETIGQLHELALDLSLINIYMFATPYS